MWGAATAAHQVEGGNVHSDWWKWEQDEAERPRSGRACDHYRLYKSDFRLAKRLGHNSHRLSLEWARLEPTEGVFDKREVEHYRDVLSTLKKELGMTTLVTLHHFTNPGWFAKKGGFENKANLAFFERYAVLCAEEFGDLVDYWLVINEPITYVANAYVMGFRPPQKESFWAALRVLVNLGLAHNLAYRRIHDIRRRAKVSSAHQLVSLYSEGGGWFDRALCRLTDFLANDLFLILTSKNHDFVGVNYYFHNRVSWKNLFRRLSHEEMVGVLGDRRRDLGWSMSLEGLIWSLRKLKRMFGDKEIVITEHGIADASDRVRKVRIGEAVKVIGEAIEEGINVRGYMHWSLLDNFEWSLGFEPRFGLVEVDYKTMGRKPRESARYLGKIAKNNRLSADI